MAHRTIHPIGDHIVVQFSKERERTDAGIVIPDVALEAPQNATVIAVGPGSRGKSGQVVPIEIHAGEEILVARFAGAKVILDDQAYTILRSGDILAVRT